MDFYLILYNIYDIIPIIYLVSMGVVPDYYSLLIILVPLHTGVENDFRRKYGKKNILKGNSVMRTKIKVVDGKKVVEYDMRDLVDYVGILRDKIKAKADEMLKKGLWPCRVHLNVEEWEMVDGLKHIDGMRVFATDLVPYAMIEARTYMDEVKFEEVER